MSNLETRPIHHRQKRGYGEVLTPLLQLSCFFFPKCPVAHTSPESALALTVGITLGALWYPNSQSVFVGLSLSCYLFQQKTQPPTADIRVEQGTFRGRNSKLLQPSNSPRGASSGVKDVLMSQKVSFPSLRGKSSTNPSSWGRALPTGLLTEREEARENFTAICCV